MDRHALRCLIAAGAMALFGSTAMAASPREELTVGWLRELAGPFGLTFENRGYDVATQTVSLGNVRIGNLDRDLFEIGFDALSVEDPRAVADGTFAAHAVRASGYRLSAHFDLASWFPGLVAKKAAGEAQPPSPAPAPMPPAVDYAATADTLLLERLVMPMHGPDLAAEGNFFDKYIRFARWLSGLRADWIEADNLEVATTGSADAAMKVSYDTAFASGIKEGRIERAGINGLKQEPAAGQPLRRMSIDSIYVIGADFAAALDVIDPAAYADGRGDGIRRTVYTEYGASSMRLELADDVRLTVGNIEADGLYMRQTERPLLSVVSDLIAHPDEAEADPFAVVDKVLPAITGLMGIDLVQMSDLKISGGERFDFAIGSMDLNTVDASGIGALTFRNLSTKAKDDAISASLNLLTFQNVRFGSLKPLLALARAEHEASAPTPALIRNAIVEGGSSAGFIEAISLSIDGPKGSGGFDSFAITSSDYLKMLPRRLDVTFTNASAPVALIENEDARKQLAAMGYDRLSLSGALTAGWDTESGDILIDDLRLKAKDMGSLSATLHLGNLPLSIFDDPAAIEARSREGTLVGGSLLYGNEGVVEKAFEVQARKAGQDGDTLRKNIAGALPLMLSFLNDPDIQSRFAGPIQSFLNEPKSIALTMAPKAPVPFSAFEAIDTGSPAETFRLINLDVVANR